jgi:archaellum component FlaF (FlaF/FlaG flagellin family)
MMIGVTEVLLLQPGGVLLLSASLVGIGVLYWVIDPKLRAISDEYETRQAAYAKELERKVRWHEGEA